MNGFEIEAGSQAESARILFLWLPIFGVVKVEWLKVIRLSPTSIGYEEENSLLIGITIVPNFPDLGTPPGFFSLFFFSPYYHSHLFIPLEYFLPKLFILTESPILFFPDTIASYLNEKIKATRQKTTIPHQ